MANWTTDRAKLTYAIPHWSNGYVDVADDGDLLIRPRGDEGPALDLPDIVDKATAEGLRLPLLVRFPDILADRLARLQQAFAKAIDDADYAGCYTAIYPIKVNQQSGVVSELVAAGEHGFGLEAGSKPELMAVLAHAQSRQHGRLQRLQGSRVHPPRADRPEARPARYTSSSKSSPSSTTCSPRRRRSTSSRCSACACASQSWVPASGRTPVATRASSA